MRIWSIHPKYLDTKGLLALWRETLLAKKVLEGKTAGYRMHPQLDRFKSYGEPVEGINFYLKQVWRESEERGFRFNKDKFKDIQKIEKISITSGQVVFEIRHLLKKLSLRDGTRYNELKRITTFELHPLFCLVDGDLEPWEKI